MNVKKNRKDKAKVLSHFNLAMIKAGHYESFRRTLTTRILAKYDKSMANRLEGKQLLGPSKRGKISGNWREAKLIMPAG